MKTLAIIALFCLPTSVFGMDFGNWFFNFHLKECEISGKIFSSKDEGIGTYTGNSTGELSLDGTKFTISFEYVYLPRGNKEKYDLVWTKGQDGVFRSSSDNLVKNKYSCELIIEDKVYKWKTTYADGSVVKDIGSLDKDKVLRSIATARNKAGEIFGIVKHTQSERKKVADKPEG